jgi:hypothetical protein
MGHLSWCGPYIAMRVYGVYTPTIWIWISRDFARWMVWVVRDSQGLLSRQLIKEFWRDKSRRDIWCQ